MSRAHSHLHCHHHHHHHHHCRCCSLRIVSYELLVLVLFGCCTKWIYILYIQIYIGICIWTRTHRGKIYIIYILFARSFGSVVWRSLHVYIWMCCCCCVFLLLIIIWIRVRVNELRLSIKYRVWYGSASLFLPRSRILMFVLRVVCVCMQFISFYHTAPTTIKTYVLTYERNEQIHINNIIIRLRFAWLCYFSFHFICAIFTLFFLAWLLAAVAVVFIPFHYNFCICLFIWTCQSNARCTKHYFCILHTHTFIFQSILSLSLSRLLILSVFLQIYIFILIIDSFIRLSLCALCS